MRNNGDVQNEGYKDVLGLLAPAKESSDEDGESGCKILDTTVSRLAS